MSTIHQDRSQKPVTPPQSLRATSRDDAPSLRSRGMERPREAIGGNVSRRRFSTDDCPEFCENGRHVRASDGASIACRSCADRRELARLRAVAPEVCAIGGAR